MKRLLHNILGILAIIRYSLRHGKNSPSVTNNQFFDGPSISMPCGRHQHAVGVFIHITRMKRFLLEQKAAQIERLKDFSENIVESLNVGVLAVDFGGAVESWNTQLEGLIGVPREEAVGRKLEDVEDPKNLDFLKKAPSLIAYANRYREAKIPDSYRVEFIPYDWTLNQN